MTEIINLNGYKIHILKNDNCVGQSLKRGIYWEYHFNDLYIKYYKKNTNMIDIGANIGTHSLLMSDIVSPGNFVYSFEPIFSDIVQKNIIENKKEHIIKNFDCGLGNENQKMIKINQNHDYSITRNFGCTTLRHNKILKNGDIIQNENDLINIITLDSLNLKDISLIKIDVEGYELKVLEGGENTINNNKPAIIIELWDEISLKNIKTINRDFFIEQTKKVIDLLEKWNYSYSRIKPNFPDFICLPN